MPTSHEQLGLAVTDALARTANESDRVKNATIAIMTNALIPKPDAKDAAWLWKALVSGLLAVMVISLIGIIWTVTDRNDKTSADVLVTIFTSTLTALIGLFVKSPTSA